MSGTILVADDDRRVLKLVAVTLGSGHRLLQAVDGAQALDIAQRERPDLILLDIRMPRVDGLEVCRRLKNGRATADIKVVMLTGMGQDEDRAAGMKAGADEYFVKPFSPRALLDKVHEMLK